MLPDPSLELLNFSTGVNSTPESEVVLVFSSMIIPSDEERLCFEVTGLLAGRGNTLDKFNDSLEVGLVRLVDSEPVSLKTIEGQINYFHSPKRANILESDHPQHFSTQTFVAQINYQRLLYNRQLSINFDTNAKH